MKQQEFVFETFTESVQLRLDNLINRFDHTGNLSGFVGTRITETPFGHITYVPTKVGEYPNIILLGWRIVIQDLLKNGWNFQTNVSILKFTMVTQNVIDYLGEKYTFPDELSLLIVRSEGAHMVEFRKRIRAFRERNGKTT